MAKKLTVELMANGAPCQGVPVKVTGCSELETGAQGSVFFLVDEEAVTVSVDGQTVHSASLDALPSKLSLVKDGNGWAIG